METVTRSLKLDLFLDEEHKEHYKTVVGSIRQYRAALRKGYSFLSEAQAAGATIEFDPDSGNDAKVTPNRHAGRIIAALACGAATIEPVEPTIDDAGKRVRGQGDRYTIQIGRGDVYELKPLLQSQMPTMMSYVVDSARRDIGIGWKARDPEFTRATRGWLTLQGSRGLAQFNDRGIGLPRSTARPKIEKHLLKLKWDHRIGEVPFKIGRLDGGRYRVWRSLRDGAEDWTIGTIYLSERGGKIFAVVSYSKPKTDKGFESDKQLIVRLRGDDPDTFMAIVAPSGSEDPLDTIGVHAVLGWLRNHQARKLELERRRQDCGNKKRPWGHKHGWLATQNVLGALTRNRTRVVMDYNHAWSRRIISRCLSWRCGKILVEKLPENIHGYPWNWSHFAQALNYKADEVGIQVEWAVEPPQAETPENNTDG